MTGVVDNLTLSALWDERWSGCPKVPYGLRRLRDRWVRFHTLPEAKRYPGTAAEYGTVLARHNAVLTELVTESAVLVVTAGHSDTARPVEPGRSPETVAVHRWLSEVFEPTVAAVPAELWGKRDAAELFHEALEHRWYLSQQSGEDVGMAAAADAYVENVLRHEPDERAVLEPRAPSGDES